MVFRGEIFSFFSKYQNLDWAKDLVSVFQVRVLSKLILSTYEVTSPPILRSILRFLIPRLQVWGFYLSRNTEEQRNSQT